MDDPLHDGEADPRSFEFVAMQPLKWHEQFLRKLGVEPDTVVADEQRLPLPADLDPRVAPRGRELHRVADEVFEHDPDEVRVRMGTQARLDRPRDLSSSRLFLRLGRNGLDELRQADARPPHRLAAETRQIQHVVDELRHPPRGLAHPRQVLFPSLIELVLIADEKLAAEAIDAPQRRAEIVRHGVAEGFELLIGLAEPCGQLLDALALLLDVGRRLAPDGRRLAPDRAGALQLFHATAQNLVRPLERRARGLQLMLPAQVLVPKTQGE